MRTLDLDLLFPSDSQVVFEGKQYPLPGTIGAKKVIRAVQLMRDLEVADNTDDGELQVRVLEAMLAEANDLVRKLTPKAPELDFSPGQYGALIGFIASGGQSTTIDQAVLDAIVGQKTQAELDAEESEGKQSDRPTRASRAKRPTTSPSQKRSRARSSASA